MYSLRDRIDDQEIKMKYIETLKMVSDLGTKNLGVRQFEFLRDLMNGYALVRASARKKDLPSMVIAFD